MLIALSLRTTICQSVAEVYLTGVAPLGALNHKFNFLTSGFNSYYCTYICTFCYTILYLGIQCKIRNNLCLTVSNETQRSEQ